MAKTILLVDDNPIIRKLVSQLLESGEDYVVCAQAVDGQEGIDLAQKYHPNLIILDLSMPVLNGLDAARGLKTTIGIPSPVVSSTLATALVDVVNTPAN